VLSDRLALLERLRGREATNASSRRAIQNNENDESGTTENSEGWKREMPQMAFNGVAWGCLWYFVSAFVKRPFPPKSILALSP
jgi:hypothetical protein